MGGREHVENPAAQTELADGAHRFFTHIAGGDQQVDDQLGRHLLANAAERAGALLAVAVDVRLAVLDELLDPADRRARDLREHERDEQDESDPQDVRECGHGVRRTR